LNLGERLGYSADQKLVLIHADDVGSTHSANLATFELLESGSITCGSIIVPGPWFPEVADYARSHREADFGVHLALTSEYPHYRWPGVLGRGVTPSLHDAGGYLPQPVAELKGAKVEEARSELRAQVEKALDAGIDVTHLDTHMGAVLRGGFFPVYVALALEFHLPCFVIDDWKDRRPEEFRLLAQARAPILDRIVFDTWEYSAAEAPAYYQRVLSELAPGVTHFLIHPCLDSDEIRAVDPVNCEKRIGDYLPFRGRGFNDLLDEAGVKRIGYREIRDAWRGGALV
jgi:predicted glycoside hydrolase/deacetylase ChbG (UPF0249 family)